MVTVLKLGGSVVTDKTAPETVDEGAVERAAATIADAPLDPGELVVVHGGGSFGHHHADAHGVSVTAGTHDAAAVDAIHGGMTRLAGVIVGALREAGVAAVPVHPFSLAHRDVSGQLTLPAAGCRTLLGEGFTPVLHGDAVPHAGRGATILSGDELVVSLAESLGADRVGSCSTVPGVLDEDGDVVPRVASMADVADAVGESDATDVTGGMAGKVRSLLELSTPACIFGLEGLEAFLAGDSPGTAIGATR
jgi:isopentenyl phosphate kinase